MKHRKGMTDQQYQDFKELVQMILLRVVVYSVLAVAALLILGGR